MRSSGAQAHSVTPLRLATPTLVALMGQAAPAAPDQGQPVFQPLGQLPSPAPVSVATAVSGDGSIVAGYSRVALPWVTHAFLWTAERGMEDLGHPGPPGADRVWPTYFSADGSTMIGYTSRQQNPSLFGYYAFRWRRETGFTFLDEVGDYVVFQCSGDGRVIPVPTFGGWRWVEGRGIESLGPIPEGFQSEVAYGCSADGRVIAGSLFDSSPMRPLMRWTAKGGAVSLGLLAGATQTYNPFASADGSVIIGTAYGPTGTLDLFRWTANQGIMNLGEYPGSEHWNTATGLSAAGRVAVGVGQRGTQHEYSDALIWDARHGLRMLQEDLHVRYGFELPGWHLYTATGISSDGRAIVGAATRPGTAEAFRLVLPPVCVADWDENGRVDLRDFFAFLRDYSAGTMGADLNDDGAVRADDFLWFVSDFNQGCP
jgi:probable HAF family extracellular repeat protein